MFFLFFLTIDIYFLISAVITQIFIAAAELARLTGIPIEEAKAEIETHPIIAEAKICKCFCASYLLIHFALFLQ